MIDISALDVLIIELPKAINNAMNLSAQSIASEESERTKGELAKSFKPKKESNNSFLIESTKPYAEFIENGRDGFSAKPGKTLRFVVNGHVIFRKSVGPAKAQPFVENSLKSATQDIQTIFHEEISKVA